MCSINTQLFFPIIAILIWYTGAQITAQPVARIGSTSLSGDEFLERYELTPVFGKQNISNQGENKLKFLYTLIAEKLWALQALEEKLDTTDAMKITYDSFLKMFVRDFLYQKEIRSKVNLSDLEILTAYARNSTRLYVNYLISEDKEEIDDLYAFLNQGIPFDTILAESPELSEQTSPLEIVYGQMDESIEDSLYKLKKGDYTSPILTPDGWYIFRLTNRVENILLEANELDNSYKTAIQIVQARKERELYFKFYEDYFKGIQVDVDKVLLKSLTIRLSQILHDKSVRYQNKPADKIYLEPLEVAQILQDYAADTLNQILIKFSDDPITLRKYILILGFDGFSVTETSLESVFKKLNSRTRSFIEKELLSREGIKREYQNERTVKTSLKMWFDNYLFQMLQSRFIDSVSVTDQEAHEFYKSYSKDYKFPSRLNIVEILTDSLEIVTRVLAEVEKGTDFKTLALLYNKREFTKVKGGEYGLTPVSFLGELGRIASMMAIGDVYGPIKLPEGYSVIKLLDKEIENIDKSRQPFEKVKTKIISDLRFQKMKKIIISYTAGLAIKFGIDINPDVLNSIQTTGVNSFGIRYMGFGGRITAAPLLPPQEDWIDEYFFRKNQLP
ncbi:MAG: peptidyl-prolyl cis-trans isomerase [Ignavibacteriaceae bacterium]